MKTLKFKCTLLTDVILNVKSASEGANSTLDFIPGSCFLGIVASQLYSSVSEEMSMTLFHSGKVRFGDAHPSDKGKRALRIPASFFFAKGDSIKDKCYVHHHIIDFDNIKAKSGAKAQLKQCRSGFYVMTDTEGYEVKTDKSFAIKSAYDRNERRSKDAAMYGYESLSKGLEMLFSVEVDDDSLVEMISKALIGEKRVGRSRTAQYGLVKISEFDYDEVKNSQPSKNQIVVYADSRLIFLLDDNGLPTFRPQAKDLGVEGGEIVWEKSQIRTFQYAPWNYTRQCYDTDRCGIEKGSVIVIEGANISDIKSRYIGSYNNEGFGKVIFNPEFLQTTGENGLSKCSFKDVEKPSNKENSPICDSPLFKYLEEQKNLKENNQKVYEGVEVFNASLFEGKEKFASQWGAIRSIALRNKDNKNLKSEIEDYISHGEKAQDWDGKRKDALCDFMKKNQNTLWESIINLASEMAKKCSK